MLTPPITELGFRVCANAANGVSTNDAVGTAKRASFAISRLVYNMGQMISISFIIFER